MIFGARLTTSERPCKLTSHAVNFVRSTRRSTAGNSCYINGDGFPDIVSWRFEVHVLYTRVSSAAYRRSYCTQCQDTGTSFFACPVSQVFSISDIAYKNLDAITKQPGTIRMRRLRRGRWLTRVYVRACVYVCLCLCTSVNANGIFG